MRTVHRLSALLPALVALHPAFPAADDLRLHGRRYELYAPEVAHSVIYEGRLGEGHYAYNHMASVEWFDGRFHCVWGGHAETHKEGAPGQVNLWATSADFRTWGAPVEFAHDGAPSIARDPRGKQWQPNLLNILDRELWCVWSFQSANEDLDGLYLSALAKGGGPWRHRRILRRYDLDGKSCEVFATQNPARLPSGRVLAPVTLIHRPEKGAADPAIRRWNACFYTDDDGATWACSDPVSSIDSAGSQWEPFFYAQRDGRIRAFMRNSIKEARGEVVPPGNQWRLTTVGTGTDKGEPVRFPDDPVFSFMETVSCRPQVFQLAGGRYCLLQQDAFVDHPDYQSRLNVALHFSRGGADDFVAGPAVSRPDIISAYPQGVARDDGIYVAYTTGPGNLPRSIEGAIVTPAPVPDRYYVWPRTKELVRLREGKGPGGHPRMMRANPGERTSPPQPAQADGRKVLRFADRASAGVDIDPVDFDAGDMFEFEFDAKVLCLQPAGMLILCSLGDRLPIRLGVPANRPGRLYAYTRDQWRPVCDFSPEVWHSLRVTVRADGFDVAVNGGPTRAFPNPIVNPSPRLYLGDGFETEIYPSNAGSEFLIALDSLRSRVRHIFQPSSIAP